MSDLFSSGWVKYKKQDGANGYEVHYSIFEADCLYADVKPSSYSGLGR
jgi:hypothetical protein